MGWTQTRSSAAPVPRWWNASHESHSLERWIQSGVSSNRDSIDFE